MICTCFLLQALNLLRHVCEVRFAPLPFCCLNFGFSYWWIHSPNRRSCFPMLYLKLHSPSFYTQVTDFQLILYTVQVRVHSFACRKLLSFTVLFILTSGTFFLLFLCLWMNLFISTRKNKAKWNYQSFMVFYFRYLELFILETISIHTLLFLGRNIIYIFEGTYHEESYQLLWTTWNRGLPIFFRVRSPSSQFLQNDRSHPDFTAWQPLISWD